MTLGLILADYLRPGSAHRDFPAPVESTLRLHGFRWQPQLGEHKYALAKAFDGFYATSHLLVGISDLQQALGVVPRSVVIPEERQCPAEALHGQLVPAQLMVGITEYTQSLGFLPDISELPAEFYSPMAYRDRPIVLPGPCAGDSEIVQRRQFIRVHSKAGGDGDRFLADRHGNVAFAH